MNIGLLEFRISAPQIQGSIPGYTRTPPCGIREPGRSRITECHISQRVAENIPHIAVQEKQRRKKEFRRRIPIVIIFVIPVLLRYLSGYPHENLPVLSIEIYSQPGNEFFGIIPKKISPGTVYTPVHLIDCISPAFNPQISPQSISNRYPIPAIRNTGLRVQSQHRISISYRFPQSGHTYNPHFEKKYPSAGYPHFRHRIRNGFPYLNSSGNRAYKKARKHNPPKPCRHPYTDCRRSGIRMFRFSR